MYPRLVSQVILLLCFVGICLHVQAQDSGFTEGYIITLEKDTVRGMVKHINAFPSHIMDDILFKEYNVDQKERYNPNDLVGFASGRIIYHSMPYLASDFTRKKAFMELSVSGEVNLYYWTWSGMGVNAIGTTPYLFKKGDKEAIEVPSFGFRKMLSNYFSGYEELAAEIKAKKYSRDDLDEIVFRYNSWKHEGDIPVCYSCIPGKQ